MEIRFIDQQHEQNYNAMKLRYRYVDFDKDGEYRSTCYIAALPEIFKCFALEKQSNGPFEWLFDYYEDLEQMHKGKTSGNTAPLTGATWALCGIALSLWNGRGCDLSGIAGLDPELYLVVLQALDLRRRQQSFLIM